ncbi:hypothetical protein T310_5540 [Rasamsonia emersonii CBS 393.64]|uniref:Nuclear pore complex protein Nup85 n=1 Tax=Rasamsonia emersonii (strain ATCC 16479 / CBS 393.64 / IMI 116815) TaxID=1408163 RepID=A0A0F4YRD9_RASE3|nr:hypothetical protein T310_5540 [Rasamsonia emersonii CBS 393.64]KKA20421.1 hypothetical protein T310_5540 [Rasamsonia emersonii CBS 393.64]
MAFSVPLSSSPPSTPDKSRSLASNQSTTPAGPPPSSVASFTPQGPPPSTVFGSSGIGSRSKLSFSQSAFSQSGNFDGSESLGSSFASSNYPLPGTKKNGRAGNSFGGQSLFSTTNGSSFGGFGNRGRNMSGISERTDDDEDDAENEDEDYEDEEEEQESEGEEEGEEEEEEDAEEEDAEEEDADGDMDVETTNNTSAPALGKKPSPMPSIVRDIASRSSVAAVTEPSDMIVETEEQIGELYDKAREAEYREIDLAATLSEVSTALTQVWNSCAERERQESRPFRAAGGIGPGESATGIEKASFLASLLLPLHQRPLVNVGAGNQKSSAIRAASRSLVLSGSNAKTYVPIPKVLIDWLNENHGPQTDEVQALRAVGPNPTASPNFWNTVQAAILRGRFAETAELLRSADFNYARSALEDGLAQPGYRGAQLQNIQKSVNKAIQLLESSPLVQHDDWDVTGVEWAAYRKRVNSALQELEEFAEGQDPPQPAVGGGPRFQAVNFGMSQGPSLAQNGFSFTQSSRMAESRVPWSIYQNLKGLYGIILGQPPAIMAQAQDWVEATIGLTAWWDGEDDSDPFAQSTNGFGASTTSNKSSKTKSPSARPGDANLQDAYIRRLDYSFGAVTEDTSGKAGYQPNSLNTLEVGLASVFEGNVEGVLQLLQTWSLCIASAVAEVASFGGWWETSGGSKPLSGFLSENDLMVLSYGQDGNTALGRLRKDDTLTAYANGLFRRPTLGNDSVVREGWEIALEVLSRLDDADTMRKTVSELLDKLPLENIDRVDKVVLLCTDLGLENEGRKISEKYGDQIVDTSEEYGLALICYARAHSKHKTKAVVDLLISCSLVQSRAYPPAEKLDEQLRTLLRQPKACLSAIASVDSEAARILQFYVSGYATLRRFYETRDEAVTATDGQAPRLKPLARKRAAANALVTVIQSAADSIYGGLYDPDRDSAVQVDGLLALLGEALVFVNESAAPILNVAQQSAILSAIEDLETVTRPRCRSRGCIRVSIVRPSALSRTLLKKSVSDLTVSSSFSLIGSEMLDPQGRSNGGGLESASGVLVPRPGENHNLAGIKRGWDWRAGLPEDAKAEDVLRILRLGLAKDAEIKGLFSTGCEWVHQHADQGRKDIAETQLSYIHGTDNKAETDLSSLSLLKYLTCS